MDRSAGDTTLALDARIADLIARGVEVVDPRQLWIAPDVVPTRVHAGARLWPGTRLLGARTFVAPGAEVGAEGPATLHDAVLGPGAIVDSGFVHGAVLLDGARLGANAHVRPGTLLEEGASTAHAVGLKQTILLAHVTLGSLINFCDVLMAGGTSRRDHSEVGSGFIHFNFTPWGASGDKATPSLVGDVVAGVLLRQPRIFLGGAGGMIGPRRVEYGAIAAAGQVLRRDVAAGKLVSQPTPTLSLERRPHFLDGLQPRLQRNLEYIAQLVALSTWYREVRRARARTAIARELVDAALHTIAQAITERIDRARAFARERGASLPAIELAPSVPCPLSLDADDGRDHLAWVAALDDDACTAAAAWLRAVADRVVTPAD
ncbi:MAG: UDP-N-acetylglucosamine pyrophosphorylase [Deltaproteobacteria bacterium]|nr:UDP-N-acetylglucosamine pyrophosphorylase [Deltaproteobacteria bacterium]MBK8239306.1 UDP-N-acetylglucosamine pyrophosphorylase [Deltaproteobacteria bacterium]MBK8719617.1 UDP-N-acetylglucosamine pyrophosphorylase [Deltaproteobacteria bacterium]MBP7290907.1 UDP-N-acetylglucosamine pyrophosphorylase [Nannocystaceae bacterium]